MQFTDEFVRAVLQHCPRLEALTLAGLACITDSPLMDLWAKLPGLKYAYVRFSSRCSYLVFVVHEQERGLAPLHTADGRFTCSTLDAMSASSALELEQRGCR